MLFREPVALLQMSVRARMSSSESSPFSTRRRRASRCQAGGLGTIKDSSRTLTFTSQVEGDPQVPAKRHNKLFYGFCISPIP